MSMDRLVEQCTDGEMDKLIVGCTERQLGRAGGARWGCKATGSLLGLGGAVKLQVHSGG